MKPSLLVLAAGLGSRYGGVKQIDSVGAHDETLLDYSIYDAVKAGYGPVVFIIRPDIEADFRERLFDRIARNVDATYVMQTRESLLDSEQILQAEGRKKPWGTTHAMLCAKDVMKSPFTVINADDYYGPESFVTQGRYLETLSNTDTCHSMVGYFLKNTMTPVGTVSRGVCQVKDGILTSMRENKEIEYRDGRIVSHLPEGDVYLTGDEWVSMNFFGFTPAVFDYMIEYWEDFIRENIKEPKTECLLPDCVGKMVKDGRGSLKVFSTSETWFGMTYHEDREVVKRNLALKTKQGVYPEMLWEK